MALTPEFGNCSDQAMLSIPPESHPNADLMLKLVAQQSEQLELQRYVFEGGTVHNVPR